jgi:hypothetical protein
MGATPKYCNKRTKAKRGGFVSFLPKAQRKDIGQDRRSTGKLFIISYLE